MKDLDLTYLNILKEHPIVEVLKKYGAQISSKTNGVLSYITTYSSEEDEIHSATFYIVAPEINRQHQLITVDVESVVDLKVILWSLSKQPIHKMVKIKKDDYSSLEETIGNLLDDTITKEIFKLFIEQTKLKWDIRKSWKM